jgi:hypothetical protein
MFPRTILFEIGFEVLTTVVMKSSVFWDIMLYSLLKVNRRFGGTRHLQLQSSVFYLLHAGFLLDLFVEPEDGS